MDDCKTTNEPQTSKYSIWSSFLWTLPPVYKKRNWAQLFYPQNVEVILRLRSKPRTCSPMPSLGTITTREPLTVNGWSQRRKAMAWSSSSRPLRSRRRPTAAMTTWSSLMEMIPSLHGWDVTAAQGWEKPIFFLTSATGLSQHFFQFYSVTAGMARQ